MSRLPKFTSGDRLAPSHRYSEGGESRTSKEDHNRGRGFAERKGKTKKKKKRPFLVSVGRVGFVKNSRVEDSIGTKRETKGGLEQLHNQVTPRKSA